MEGTVHPINYSQDVNKKENITFEPPVQLLVLSPISSPIPQLPAWTEKAFKDF